MASTGMVHSAQAPIATTAAVSRIMSNRFLILASIIFCIGFKSGIRLLISDGGESTFDRLHHLTFSVADGAESLPATWLRCQVGTAPK